jgi:signal transduction histidine kinase
MSDLDTALRTLSRMQNAAPPVAANKISNVMNLLLRLNAENEYLNARLMESLNAPSEFEPPVDAEDTPVKPLNTPDVPILEELFRVDRSSTLNLFSSFDAELFTDEMPAVSTPTAPEPTSEADAQLDFYQHLEAIIAERTLPEDPDDKLPSQIIDLSEEERQALARTLHSGWLPQLQSDLELPDADMLLGRINEVFKPSLILLRGQAESLVEGKLGRMSSNQLDALKLMLSNAENALALLDSFELIQQLRHHSLNLQIQDFRAEELLTAAQQVVQARANAHEHQIMLQSDDTLPLVRADFERSLIILIDLLDNAIRYMPNDGSIRISADTLGTHVLITVADNGIGLTPEDCDQVGKPFWRAMRQPLVRHHPGSGLRLFLAKRILEVQGGELFFSGEPNLGSSFSFTLPAVENITEALA